MTSRALRKACIPRRMYYTDNEGARVEEVEKALPYVDPGSGTKNRLVERDPISGLGNLPKEHDPLGSASLRSRIPRRVPKSEQREQAEEIRDPIVGRGPLGAEFTCMYDTKNVRLREKNDRDPIALRGNLGQERDIIHGANPRPKRVRDVKGRNPISGTGDHGKEWDVIYGYDGRPRRSKSAGPETRRRLDGFRYSYKYLDDYLESKGNRGNPITGENVTSYDIMNDDMPKTEARRSRRDMFEKRNPVTGENCKEDLYSREMSYRAKRERSLHNPLTGEECDSFSVHMELERRRAPSANTPRANPLTGANCLSYTYMQESRARRNQEFIYTNPLTGCNRDTYFIIDFENKINRKPFREGSNPLTGQNCSTYTVNSEEKERPTRTKEMTNPVTGAGCSHYVLATDERKPGSPRAAGFGNPITGEKCDSYEINMDMRSSRKLPADTRDDSDNLEDHNGVNGHVAADLSAVRRPTAGKYNPLTGEAY